MLVTRLRRLPLLWRRLSKAGKMLTYGTLIIVTLLVYKLGFTTKPPEMGNYILPVGMRLKNLHYCPQCATALSNCFPSCLCPESLDPSPYNPADNPQTQPFDPEDVESRCPKIPSARPKKEAYAFYFSCRLLPEKSIKDEKKFKAFIASFQVAVYSVKKSGTSRPIVVVIPSDEQDSPQWKKYSKYLTWLTDDSPSFTLVKVKWGGKNELQLGDYYQRLMVFGLNYDRVIVLDEDMLLLKNIDVLFNVDRTPAFAFNHTVWQPEIQLSRYMGNAGLMVIDPSPKLYTMMVDNQPLIPSYDKTEKGYIISFFRFWYQIPSSFIFDKFILDPHHVDIKADVIDKVYALHFLGRNRPLTCESKEEDCNKEEYMKGLVDPFNSNEMHTLWNQMYDSMIAENYFPKLA